MSAPNVDVESHNAGRERNQASSRPALSWSDQLQQPGVKTVTIRTNNGNNNARSQTKFPESIVVVPDRRLKTMVRKDRKLIDLQWSSKHDSDKEVKTHRFKGDNRKSLDDAQAAVQLVLNYDTREASTVKPNVRHMSGLSIKSINLQPMYARQVTHPSIALPRVMDGTYINAHAIVTSDGSDSHTVHYSARASKKISSKRTSRTTRSQVSNSLAFLPIARTAPIYSSTDVNSHGSAFYQPQEALYSQPSPASTHRAPTRKIESESDPDLD